MKTQFFIVFIFLPFLIKAQIENDSVLIRIQELNRLCEQADTLSPWDDDEILGSILYQISEDISILLQNPSVSCTRLENSIGAFIQTVKSEDTLIWVFEWDEKTGGSYRSCSKIVCYYDVNGKRKIVTGNNGEEDKGYLIYNDLWTGRIYKLNARKNIYLISGGAQTCNTCYTDYFSTFVLTDSGLIAYPSFYGETLYYETADDFKTSSVGINYRWNPSNGLEFDVNKQTIISSYFEDDLSGYYGDPDSARYFTDTLVFDGDMFLNSMQKYFLQLIALTIKYDSIKYEDENFDKDSFDWLNSEMVDVIIDLVTSPQFDEKVLEDLKSIGPWEIINSDDNRCVMISWQSDPNASPQFATEKNMFFFRDEKQRYHLFWDEDKDFPSESSDYEAFYHLKSDPSIYILSSNELGCIYCENTDYAQVIQIVNDSLNLNYPAFENQSEIYNDPGYAAIAYGFDFDEDSDELYYHINIEDTNERYRENVKIYKFENGIFKDISPDPLGIQIEELKKMMDQLSFLKAKKKNASLLDSLNIIIYNRLYYLLSQPEIINYKLEEIIKNDFFTVTRSEDEMMNIYTWKTNKNNEQLIYMNLIQSLIYPYLHANHMISNVSGDRIDMNVPMSADSLIFYSSVLYDTIYKLSGDGYYNQYLVIGHEYPCRNCEGKFAKVLITDDLEIYEAEVFEDKNEISIQARSANVIKFEYDPLLQILSYSYKEDEVSGYSIDKKHPQIISGAWKYNGNEFVPVIK